MRDTEDSEPRRSKVEISQHKINKIKIKSRGGSFREGVVSDLDVGRRFCRHVFGGVGVC